MEQEKKHLLQSLYPPGLFLIAIWIIWLGEWLSGIDLGFLGIYPLTAKGLTGIITGPLIHANLSHLFANSVPLFILGACLFYFYREIAYKTFVLIYLLTGISVWLGAREAYHIGASGIVYGLASFLFFSGIFRRDIRLMAITMFVTFLYGSMVWGIFPEMFPEKNISWESHLWGLIVGMVLAFYFRKEGPQKKKYDWEDEEDDEDEFEKKQAAFEEYYRKTRMNGKDPDNINIKYHYRDNQEGEV
jgi:membrane associated rhomboid family serine protease